MELRGSFAGQKPLVSPVKSSNQAKATRIASEIIGKENDLAGASKFDKGLEERRKPRKYSGTCRTWKDLFATWKLDPLAQGTRFGALLRSKPPQDSCRCRGHCHRSERRQAFRRLWKLRVLCVGDVVGWTLDPGLQAPAQLVHWALLTEFLPASLG